MDFAGRRASAALEAAIILLITALVASLTGWTPFPAAAAPRASDQVSLEGSLRIRQGDDFEHGRILGHQYFLANGDGLTELAFDQSPPDDGMAGLRVHVRGHFRGGRFVVAAGGIQTDGRRSQSVSNAATGSKRIAVVLMNFSNDQSEPYTRQYAQGIAFDNTDSVAAYYAENSWGQLSISGEVFGWYTVPEANTSCGYGAWATSATAAASAAGVDLGAYDHVVFAFPYVSSCAWGGMATLPGRSSWLNGPNSMSLRTMAHELGHNFGTHHASALSCTENGVRVAISATCTTSEYGDPFSVMGGARHYHHTAFSRANFGWLDKADAKTVTSDGVYSFAPIEVDDPLNPSVLRIPRANTGSYLTLEFRQPYGMLFDNFSISDPVVTGITARITSDFSSAGQTQLVDATPTTTSFADASLSVGQTIHDPAYGIAVTTMSVSPTAASVAIVIGPITPPTPSPEASTPAPGPPSPAPTSSPTSVPTPSPTPTATTSPGPTPAPDIEPPTQPANLQAVLGKARKVGLSWTPSGDNMMVTGYLVFRDGVLVATTSINGFTDSLTGKGTTHTYYVVAVDAAGNRSTPSNVASIGK